jgi:hypothetical protein
MYVVYTLHIWKRVYHMHHGIVTIFIFQQAVIRGAAICAHRRDCTKVALRTPGGSAGPGGVRWIPLRSSFLPGYNISTVLYIYEYTFQYLTTKLLEYLKCLLLLSLATPFMVSSSMVCGLQC